MPGSTEFAEAPDVLAKRVYERRAATYEDSWHPDYTRRLLNRLDIRPGDRVLDLCCGTGLDAFGAAEMVGPGGSVVGVDASEAMLGVALAKQRADPVLGPRCRLLLHDATDLASLPDVREASFDWLVCSNAFVLFPDPAATVRAWRAYLRPGGRAAIDITHEHNLRSGTIMERVARRIGLDSYPSDRAWIRSADSFRAILEREGFAVEKCELLEKVEGKRATLYSLNDADAQFDYITGTVLAIPWMTDEFKGRAREVFREEWAKSAVDGKVQNVEALYLYVARKT